MLIQDPAHPVLHTPCEVIELAQLPTLQDFIDHLLEYAKYLSQGTRGCAGLAAPQIGRNLRILVYAPSPAALRARHYNVLVNPIITLRKGQINATEGCLSIPYPETVRTTRSKTVEVQAWDRHGALLHLHLDWPRSHVLQHEIDHLDGRLCTGRMATG